jgi:hypothetical protein
VKENLSINTNKHVKMQRINYQGDPLDIHFTSLLVGDGYLWLLENLTKCVDFEANFVFDLNNLGIVSS